MTWLIIPPALVVLLLVLARVRSRQSPPPPANLEALTETAIELHRIRRRLESAWIKSEQRQDATRLRRELAETLSRTDDRP